MKYDLIIIGGGPAGVSAGIYAARQRLNTLLITKDFGGQVARKAVAIENYAGFEKISGLDLIKKFEGHLRKQRITIEKAEVTKVKKMAGKLSVACKNKKKFEARTVIIASGADPRPLDVPGEKKFIGKGVSYCPACDGALFPGKTVAIIGGGNSGFETAMFLSKIVKQMYLLEAGPKVRADQINQQIVKKMKKVKVITNALLKRIHGKQFVESLVYLDKKTKKEKSLKVQGIFVDVGNQPATSFVKDLVDFNERDEIKVEYETCQTKTPGLFAAGDVNLGLFKQIITAAGEGAKAALAAYKFVRKYP